MSWSHVTRRKRRWRPERLVRGDLEQPAAAVAAGSRSDEPRSRAARSVSISTSSASARVAQDQIGDALDLPAVLVDSSSARTSGSPRRNASTVNAFPPSAGSRSAGQQLRCPTTGKRVIHCHEIATAPEPCHGEHPSSRTMPSVVRLLVIALFAAGCALVEAPAARSVGDGRGDGGHVPRGNVPERHRHRSGRARSPGSNRPRRRSSR